MRHFVVRTLAVSGLLAGVPSYGAIVVGSAFDQVATVNSLGGTVFQIGGSGPGTQLFTSGNFVGPISTLTGVRIAIPGWDFADTAGPFTDSGATEPGNIASLLTGVPTDMTFTQPGAAGPDGTIGDGSIHFTQGDFVSLFWSSVQAGTPGAGADLFIATDTNGGGKADLTFLLGGIVVDSLLKQTIPGGNAGSGQGGLLVNVSKPFDEILIRGVSGNVEIDAIGVLPTPGSLALAAPAGALMLRRRRRN